MQPAVAIACGGTGGHLFPGMAVAEQLRLAGCQVSLLISTKEVDQQAARTAVGVEVVALPAVGLTHGRRLAFVRGFAQSYRLACGRFKQRPPQAVLAMGGFTSAPPILAGKRVGARTYLHESNTIPGRANRWLSWVVDRAFVGFEQAAKGLHTRRFSVTGTPVRPQFRPQNPAACRAALGLDPLRPVVLVTGGSQGASGLNDLVTRSLPDLPAGAASWQWLHLAGPAEVEKVTAAYRALGLTAVVHPFLATMDLALGAATAAVSRAGASSLAELAAVRLPTALVPFPAATDNHQLFNARALEATGAARVLEQKTATPKAFVATLLELMAEGPGRAQMQAALAQWHQPQAAHDIARMILAELAVQPKSGPEPAAGQSGALLRNPSVLT